MFQNLFATLHAGYTDALMTVTRSGANAVANLGAALTKGTLVLEIDLYEDGMLYGEFFDTDESCWDRCNGITNRHRSGWCRTNPEHADFDCGCGEGYWDDDYDGDPTEDFDLTTAEKTALHTTEILAGLAAMAEEPF